MCGNCVLVCPAAPSACATICPAQGFDDKRTQSDRVISAFVCGAVCRGASDATNSCAQEAGFYAVSETALERSSLSQHLFDDAQRAEADMDLFRLPCRRRLHRQISSECQPHIYGVLSPLLTHCKMLRAHYGEEIAIVFIGPALQEDRGEQHPNSWMQCSPSKIWTIGCLKKIYP